MRGVKGIIFDFDGTLADSNWIWKNVMDSFIKSNGENYDENWIHETEVMEIEEVIGYLKERFLIPGDTDKILQVLKQELNSFYLREVKLKPYCKDFMSILHKQGIKMCIASATEQRLIKYVIEKYKIAHYFEDILSCNDLHTTKECSDIYHAGQTVLDTEIKETLIFEDLLTSVKTAKNAGYKVVGVYDPVNLKYLEEIRKISDLFIYSFKELLEEPSKMHDIIKDKV